ncbi:MAG TPA: AarF/UbiB family protein [Leptospiraceae bacterium]|nr:AarF/UbiB family protein [Leptospiraceae bacterium]HMW07853.1 AarF/UbiB family protein [Leptospiraceae bacterium]HMX32339.1 AarF/UbiB family protein [Leptospiraceae bacterium]HMY32658.1 AarF/UbiB family protein [Leptospiraceae bacterium]HMZ66919.1 AarF/UbiB family protein [Leptospiraceae bacterium]
MTQITDNIASGINAILRIADSFRILSTKLAQVLADILLDKKDKQLPVRLREAFEDLGATYIKLGQFIASAPSLFPKDYVDEMQKCLDSVRPIPFKTILQIIEKELGDKPEKFFTFIEEKPMASASISQVHAATTVDGFDVVLKVQRPDIEDVLKTDMNLIYLATLLFEKLSPGVKTSGLTDIVKTFHDSILLEVDFIQEAKNIEEFDKHLLNTNETRAKVPRVFSKYSTKRLLTMERFYGIPLTDLKAIKTVSSNPAKTLTDALDIWFSSLGSGMFHADVHAGNLLVLKDGKIGFIDFGIVGRISPDTWMGLMFFMEGLGTTNAKMMARGLVQMDSTAKGIDETKFAKDLEYIFDEMNEIAMSIQLGDVAGIDETRLNGVMLRISDISKNNGLKIPHEFGLLIKQMLYFDRYVKILAPEMDLIKDLTPMEAKKNRSIGYR